MRPSTDLRKLQHSSVARISRLRDGARTVLSAAASADTTSSSCRPEPFLAYVVIELDNLWASTARSLFLSAAFCARDGTGMEVTLSVVPKPGSTNEALAHAIRRCRPTRYRAGSTRPWTWNDEPLWWDQRTLLDCLEELGASNFPQVVSALSASPAVFSHLHVFRNFFAHRGKDTRERVIRSLQQLHFPRHYTAAQALMTPVRTPDGIRPQPLILDWLDDLHDTVDLLVYRPPDDED